MTSIVPLEVEHVQGIGDPGAEPGFCQWIKDMSTYWKHLADSGTAFSAFVDGEFVGCAGWISPWPGVADVWVWDAPAVHKHPLAVHGIIKRAIQMLEKDRGIRRIACEVRDGNVRGERWVRLLGFEYEGTMRKRGPDGTDMKLFAKVRDADAV